MLTRTILAVLITTVSPALAADVTYFPAEKVSAAFAKGGVLFDGAGTNYMVHASRRDAAGQVEVHTRDTDIIYMLSGTATMVTGGTIVEAHNQSPTEIRGAKITGGTTREVRKGELIIIPKGTPHWTTGTDGTVQLLVVKVQ